MKQLTDLRNRTAIAMVAIMVSVFVVACKSEPTAGPRQKCDYKGHFEKNTAVEGFYGGYIIRLENGDLITPCVVSDNGIVPSSVYDGMEITVSYRLLSNEENKCNKFNNTGILPGGCVVGPPSVQIICIGVYEKEEFGGKPIDWCGTEPR